MSLPLGMKRLTSEFCFSLVPRSPEEYGWANTALFERICKSTELTDVVAGDALENLGEVIAILFAGYLAQPLRWLLSCRESL